MRILFASSEIFPLVKTGGLADVSAGLPAALAGKDVDIRLMMPAYPEAIERIVDKGPSRSLPNLLGFGAVSLIEGRTPDSGLPVWLVDCPLLYARSGGPYTDPQGQPWSDNHQRFAVLSHAVAKVAMGEVIDDWQADLVHINDWHLGLVPALLAAQKGNRPKSLLTMHNLAFQGLFPSESFAQLELPQAISFSDLEFYGQISFLKAGIRYADFISTVSPRYAEEILTPEFGCGLDSLLQERAADLVGILNGIDLDHWNPESAHSSPTPYSAADLAGKKECKKAIQDELGLVAASEGPLFLFMSRLTEQKMADILPDVVPRIMELGGQIVICGRGDKSLEASLNKIAGDYPSRVSVHIGYEEALARRLLAGADILLAPARFEPCGLIQMYGMRYGTLPVVRRVGGLADTVIGTGSSSDGFMFNNSTADDFIKAIDAAVSTFYQRTSWTSMQSRAMSRDFGWRRSADRYLTLYREMIESTSSPQEDTSLPSTAAVAPKFATA